MESDYFRLHELIERTRGEFERLLLTEKEADARRNEVVEFLASARDKLNDDYRFGMDAYTRRMKRGNRKAE